MEAAGTRSDPHFTIGNVTVHDQLAAVGAFDFQNAVVHVPVDVGIAGLERGVECEADLRQRRVGCGNEVTLGRHGGGRGGLLGLCSMLKQISRYAMRRVAFVIAAAVALSLGATACGVKGPLVPAPKSDASTDAAPTASPTP